MRKASRILFLPLVLLLGIFPIIYATASGPPFSTGPYQTIVAVEMQVLPNDPSHMQVTAIITSINGPLPGHSQRASFWFYYNGVLYHTHSYSYSTSLHNSIVLTFTVPMKGHGLYECQTVVFGDHQQIIGDPRGMLNW